MDAQNFYNLKVRKAKNFLVVLLQRKRTAGKLIKKINTIGASAKKMIGVVGKN